MILVYIGVDDGSQGASGALVTLHAHSLIPHQAAAAASAASAAANDAEPGLRALAAALRLAALTLRTVPSSLARYTHTPVPPLPWFMCLI